MCWGLPGDLCFHGHPVCLGADWESSGPSSLLCPWYVPKRAWKLQAVRRAEVGVLSAVPLLCVVGAESRELGAGTAETRPLPAPEVQVRDEGVGGVGASRALQGGPWSRPLSWWWVDWPPEAHGCVT